jgi:hypothetical protein
MTDERLYAHQMAALSATHDCRVFVFRDHDTMGGMAHDILQNMPRALHPDRAVAGRAMRLLR